jgi:toxin ParE1/3/4
VKRLVWSPRSLQDLLAIRDYIGRDSPAYADLTVRRVFEAVERLAAFPESGRLVPELRRRDVREVIVGSLRVVYRYDGATVGVITVFNASQRFPADV